MSEGTLSALLLICLCKGSYNFLLRNITRLRKSSVSDSVGMLTLLYWLQSKWNTFAIIFVYLVSGYFILFIFIL